MTILKRVSEAWNITLTEPSEKWDMQPPMNERYTQYVLSDAERSELRAALADQPRLFSGCLLDGVCRGVCKTADCPNHDLVVAARLVVEKQVEGIVYSENG